MGKEIIIHDIDRTHRLGKRKLDNNAPRPIIVKFTRYNVRNKIFKSKKKLKGKTVSITESLTKRRVVELKKAREMHGFKNVWSQDGQIFEFLSMNSDFQTKIKFHIKSTLETLDTEGITDPQVRWEFLKYDIRKFSIEFSKLQV